MEQISTFMNRTLSVLFVFSIATLIFFHLNDLSMGIVAFLIMISLTTMAIGACTDTIFFYVFTPMGGALLFAGAIDYFFGEFSSSSACFSQLDEEHCLNNHVFIVTLFIGYIVALHDRILRKRVTELEKRNHILSNRVLLCEEKFGKAAATIHTRTKKKDA